MTLPVVEKYIKLNPLKQPCMSLEDKNKFPVIKAVYFAVSEASDFLYIGQTTNLKRRWQQHHQLIALIDYGNVKLHWIEVSESRNVKKILTELEDRFIIRFKPALNGSWTNYDDDSQEKIFQEVLGDKLWGMYCNGFNAASESFHAIRRALAE